MIKNIILATDGSDNALRAAHTAIDLAKGLSLPSITISHIVTRPPDQSRMVKAQFDVHALLEDDAKKAIAQTINALNQAEIPFNLKVAIGDPAAEVIELAKKEQADLLILGTRGLGALKGVLMGSVSQKIVQGAPCPVMIVK